MKGLDEGYDPHVLHVSWLSKENCEDVSEEIISRFWVKAHVLSLRVEAKLNNGFGKTKGISTENESEDILTLFSNVSRPEQQLLLPSSYLDHTSTVGDTLSWLDIDGSELVKDALVDDMILEE